MAERKKIYIYDYYEYCVCNNIFLHLKLFIFLIISLQSGTNTVQEPVTGSSPFSNEFLGVFPGGLKEVNFP